MDEDSVALVKDRLTISEVVEVLRDTSNYPVITDPHQRPKAVPNLHSSYVLHVAAATYSIKRQRQDSPSSIQFSCSAYFHFIPQIYYYS